MSKAIDMLLQGYFPMGSTPAPKPVRFIVSDDEGRFTQPD